MIDVMQIVNGKQTLKRMQNQTRGIVWHFCRKRDRWQSESFSGLCDHSSCYLDGEGNSIGWG